MKFDEGVEDVSKVRVAHAEEGPVFNGEYQGKCEAPKGTGVIVLRDDADGLRWEGRVTSVRETIGGNKPLSCPWGTGVNAQLALSALNSISPDASAGRPFSSQPTGMSREEVEVLLCPPWSLCWIGPKGWGSGRASWCSLRLSK